MNSHHSLSHPAILFNNSHIRHDSMPIVYHRISGLEQANSSDNSIHNGYVDFSMLLSEHYSKNIRQGQNFVLKGVSATILPNDEDGNASEDWDVGVAVNTKLSYCPTQKVTRMAWNEMFKQWKKQQYLSANLGQSVKYNDFEVGWDSSASYHNADRTSTIRAAGIGDSTTEKIMIWGQSNSSSDYTMQDYVNSKMDKASPSIDPFSGVIIKAPKFDYLNIFPDQKHFWVSAVNSASVTNVGASPVAMYSSAVLNNDIRVLPEPAHVMCGLMRINCYSTAPDTAAQLADTFDLHLEFHIIKWTPLVYRARKSRRKQSSKYVRKYRGRRKTRRYRRRKYNRR